MPRITFEWPEEGISEIINEKLWKLSEFKSIGSDQVVAAEFPDTNGLERRVVSDIIVKKNANTCSFKFFDEMVESCSFDQDITIKIRPMRKFFSFK